MKKTLVSLATASLIASTAMAADKGIDIVTSGQAVIYYQTSDSAGAADLFDHAANSAANVGVQLNLNADLGDNFSFGSQLSYLGTAGLEKVLVGATMQDSGQKLAMDGIADEIAMTKIFVAKQIDNTTVKIGRQELPKSLSPLAFSEGWNVFKNTFEAILVVNTDVPDTTLVGAYVGQSNASAPGSDISTFNNLGVKSSAGGATVTGAAYMLTAQNTSIPMTTVTASIYGMEAITLDANDAALNGANALWLDAKIADKSLPMGLKIGLQGGTIMTDSDALVDTTALGMKVGAKPMDALNVCLAFSSTSGEKDLTKHVVAFKNVGTGVKTPLYTQMVLNQDAIALDGQTVMVKGAYSFGDAGTVIAQVSQTTAGARNLNGNANDYTDAELLYKVKAGGVNFLAAYVNAKLSDNDDANQVIRLWARKAF